MKNGIFPIINTAEVDIPVGGLVRIIGFSAFHNALQVGLPNSDNQSGLLVVVGAAIPAASDTSFGQATLDEFSVLAFDVESGIPEAGDYIGSLSGSCYAHVGKIGFTCIGGTGSAFTNAIRNRGEVFGAAPPTTDRSIAVWTGTTGRLLAASSCTIDASGLMNIANGFQIGNFENYLTTVSGTYWNLGKIDSGTLAFTAGVGELELGSLKANTDVISAAYKTSDGFTGATTTVSGLVFKKGLYTSGSFSGGTGTVTSVGLIAPAAGMTVSGSPITTSGNMTITLANDLAALEGLSGVGIPKRTGTDTWTLGGIDTSDLNDGVVTLAKFEDITATRLLGRAAGTDGVMQEITLGTGFSFAGTTLNYTGTTAPAGSDKQVQFNNAGAMGAEAGFEYDKVAALLTTYGLKANASVVFAGTVSPATISTTQNDYNPAGLDNANVLNLSVSGSADITGIAGGAEGRLLFVQNNTSGTATLKTDDSGSTTTNQFSIGRDLALPMHSGCTLRYTGNRWRLFGTANTMQPLARGGTGADLSATGGTSCYLKQTTTGGVVTVGTIAAGDYPTFVAAGGSAAKGAVPPPDSTTKNNQPRILADNATWIKHSGKVLGSKSFDFDATTADTTMSTSLAELATTHRITFTLDETSDIVIDVSATVRNSGAGNDVRIGVSDGTTHTVVSRTRCLTAGVGFPCAGKIKITGLGAGSYTYQFRASVSAGTGTIFAIGIEVRRAET